MPFDGRALYDPGVIDGVAEDVSEEISMISPFETPLLDRLSPPARPAMNILHEWLQEELNPNTIVNTNAAIVLPATDPATLNLASVAGAATARFFMIGHIFENQTTGEQLQLQSKDDATSVGVFTRAFGGTTAATLTPTELLDAISDAALEGADVETSIDRPRTRLNNYAQIFKKDVIVSGTTQAVRQLGGVTDEMDHQRNMRLREIVRDLEKATIRGRSSDTIGSATVRRSMDGILARLTTNVTSTATLTPNILNDVIQGAWDNGGTDLDLIVADSNFKRIIDDFNQTRIDVVNRDERFHNKVSFFESTYGVQEVILDRWMPQNSLMVISSQRIHVVPLTGRSFRFVPVSRTGDAEKGMILGEYTMEIMNEEGMAQAGS
jgi:hypothetical protein